MKKNKILDIIFNILTHSREQQKKQLHACAEKLCPQFGEEITVIFQKGISNTWLQQ